MYGGDPVTNEGLVTSWTPSNQYSTMVESLLAKVSVSVTFKEKQTYVG